MLHAYREAVLNRGASRILGEAGGSHTGDCRSILHCPKLDRGLSALLEDMDQRGLLKETLVVAVGEFGRSPRLGVSTSGNSNSPDGRDHWPYCYSAVVAGAGIARGAQYGESDATASSPKEKPVHPADLLATVYVSLGIDPDMEIRNHLNQPRELVKGTPVMGLWSLHARGLSWEVRLSEEDGLPSECVRAGLADSR